MEFQNVKKGDKVIIADPDGLVADYISESMFITGPGRKGIDIDVLRHYCALKINKGYVVNTNSYSSESLYIDTEGGGLLKIKYKYLSTT